MCSVCVQVCDDARFKTEIFHIMILALFLFALLLSLFLYILSQALIQAAALLVVLAAMLFEVGYGLYERLS
jgi:hypothetical protein